MNDLKNEIQLVPEQEQLQPVIEGAEEKKNPVMEVAKAKLAPVMEDIKEKINPILEDAKEKIAPIIEDVREKTEDLKEKAVPVIEKVKDGAEKIGDIFSADLPGLNVKNELFDELEQAAAAQKEVAKAKAEEMQALLEKMMGKKD